MIVVFIAYGVSFIPCFLFMIFEVLGKQKEGHWTDNVVLWWFIGLLSPITTLLYLLYLIYTKVSKYIKEVLDNKRIRSIGGRYAYTEYDNSHKGRIVTNWCDRKLDWDKL